MIAQWQLCQVKIVGQLDDQACDNPLWYVTAAASGIQIATVAKKIAAIWRQKFLPFLSDKYELLRVEASALAGLEIMKGGTDVSPTYKTTRMNWSEQYLHPVNEIGGVTSPAHASFVALSVVKTVGSAYVIDYSDGVETQTLSVRGKNGSMRISGISEIDTLTTEPNRLSAACVNKFTPGLTLLREITTAQGAAPDDIDPSDVGKTLEMRVVSSSRNGAPRINKNGSASVDDWQAQWVSSDVNNLALHRYVGSQVSRKRSNTRRG